MDCLPYPSPESMHFSSSGLQYSPKLRQQFVFNAELCGIWLGALPFNQHLEATALPAHMIRTPLATPRISASALRSHSSDLTKTALPQKTSKKNSTTFSIGAKEI